jgi:hypothetical protein
MNQEPPSQHKVAEYELLKRLNSLKAQSVANRHRKPLLAKANSVFGKSEIGYDYPTTNDDEDWLELIPF